MAASKKTEEIRRTEEALNEEGGVEAALFAIWS
jgi:hypothetical protein